MKIVSQHLKELANNFDHCFLEHEDPRKGNLWINDSFIEDISNCNLDPKEKEKLIDLCCDLSLQSRYKKESTSQFRISLKNKNPTSKEKFQGNQAVGGIFNHIFM